MQKPKLDRIMYKESFKNIQQPGIQLVYLKKKTFTLWQLIFNSLILNKG